MKKKSKQLEERIQDIQHQLKEMPEGKLICSHTGPYIKWERSDGHTKTYIKKKNRPLAEKLAAKKYLTSLLDDLNHEKTAIDMYLRHHLNYQPKADALLTDSSEVQELLSPYFSPLSKELDDWMKSPYERKLKYPEHLIHQISKNEFVRSKSEAIIGKVLRMNQIPFRYECPLVLNGMTIYPDFTIRHPRTGEVFYWEHFGLVDDISYAKSVNFKMELYISNNIIPSVNLITTYETKESPLSFEMVEMLVEYYFL